MNTGTAIASRSPTLQTTVSARLADPRVTVLLCTLLLLVAPVWQMRWGTVADTSWIITVCERMLAGERLYVDLIETNPPFTLWLYMPAVAAAKAIGATPETAVYLYVSFLCLIGLGGAVFVAVKAGFAENTRLLALLPVFLALLTILPGNAFSQREHIGVSLLLPLLVLAAWRAGATPAGNLPSLGLALLCGIAASVIVMVKPYYVLLVITPALYVAIRTRSVRPLFAPEYLAAATVTVGYVGAVLRYHPEFFGAIYPMLADTYLKVSPGPEAVARYVGIFAAWAGLMLWLVPRDRLPPLTAVLAITSAAAYLPILYQGKGWAYHAYPAIALGLAALACRIAAGNEGSQLGLAKKAALALFVVACWLPYLQTQKPEDDLVAAIRATAASPSIAVVGSDIAIGHPLTRMVGGNWISPHHGDWLGAFALYLSQVAQLDADETEAARYDAMAKRFASQKMEELQAAKPDVLLMQKDDTVWRDWLARDSAYAAFLTSYRPLVEGRAMTVYVRQDLTQPVKPAG